MGMRNMNLESCVIGVSVVWTKTLTDTTVIMYLIIDV